MKKFYKKPSAGDTSDLIFRPYFKHYKTGKIIRRADGGMFCFLRKKK